GTSSPFASSDINNSGVFKPLRLISTSNHLAEILSSWSATTHHKSWDCCLSFMAYAKMTAFFSSLYRKAFH
ncbi:hypothetical protein J7L67_01260, partial [bacterium]|nr:hypothetical protein [bacterium]